MLGKQSGHALSPAVQALRPAKRNDDRKSAFGFRRDHGALGIAGSAAMRPQVIGKEWQAFEIQVVFADAFVGFARASCAKDNVSHDMRQVIKADRQPAFDRNEIDYIHHHIDLRKAFASHDSPEKGFRRTRYLAGSFPKDL